MAEFTLHPRLEDSSVFVCDLDLCQVRLNFDGDLDWLLLIPRRAGLEELIDLDDKDQAQLVKEVNFVSRVLKENTSTSVPCGHLEFFKGNLLVV